MRRAIIAHAILAAALSAAVIACNSDSVTDPNAPKNLKLSLSPGTDTIWVADTLRGTETVQLALSATSMGSPLKDPPNAVYSSENADVVTVDDKGLVRARGVGSTRVMARVNDVKTYANIAVQYATSRVLVTPSVLDILQDNAFTAADSGKLHAVAYGTDGHALPGVRYVFSSSDPATVSVDSTGVVRALKTGLAVITVQAENMTATATVHAQRYTRSLAVTKPVDSIFVDDPVDANDKVTIKPIAKDSVGTTRTGVQYTFTSSDPSVATVDASGVVTALRIGATTITTSGADLQATTALSVVSLAKTVTTTATASQWLALDTIPLTTKAFNYSGAAITGRTFTYTSSDAVATVTPTGKVVFSGPGTATITATTAFISGHVTLTALPREFVGDAAGSIAAGQDATCGLLPLDRAYCFGVAPLIGIARDTSCFGDDTRLHPCTLIPLRIAGQLQMAAVSVGDSVACGTTVTNRAYCWGSQKYGQLGNGVSSTGTSPTPALVVGAVSGSAVSLAHVAAGGNHACGLTPTGAAYCWGQDSVFQLGGGDSLRVNSTTPIPVTGGHTFTSITAGRTHTCALESGGDAYCWGDNRSGQLGAGTIGSYSDSPRLVTGGVKFVALTAGGYHTCGLTSSGAAYCWGRDSTGQLGRGVGSGSVDVPVAVTGGLAFRSISAGRYSTCGVTVGGEAYCWGSNEYGQVGNGSSGRGTFVAMPQAVAGGHSGFTVVAVGARHACAVGASGAYCWGSNIYGALGNEYQALIQPTPQKTATPGLD